MSENEAAFELAQTAADYIRDATGNERHRAVVVLGTGWASLVDYLGEVVHDIPMADVPGFPHISVSGHVARIASVRIGDSSALVLQGRTHLYEGYRAQQVVHGVRSAILSGCDTVIITNSAGGIRADLKLGQPVLIRDHINLLGRSPLTGQPLSERWGTRFVDLTEVYQPELRDLARSSDPSLAEGLYSAVPGPHFETPAEVQMLRSLGADLVGMSTTLEAIAAHHLGAKVLGISIVTDIAAGLSPAKVVHEECLDVGARAMPGIAPVIADVVKALG
jgi:purine-nucleoside phosphorylase